MAKKHWISFSQNDCRPSTNTEQIIWEPSSSEDETKDIRAPGVVTTRTRLSPILSISKQHSCTNSGSPIIGTNASADESPTIKLIVSSVNEASPVLSQRTSSLVNGTILSPIIEKRRLRMRKHQKLMFNKSNSSPELFRPIPTQFIENEYPTFDELLNSSSQATIRIEPFPSQFGSPVEEDVEAKNIKYLYYQPPKRRKTYKKGTVAHQLQMVLKRKKSRIKIWHHERLIKNLVDDCEDIVRFKFKHSWSEYGNTLVECQGLLGEEEDQSNMELFLINLGVRQVGLNIIEFDKDGVYELYPPYSTDNVVYRDKCITYYYNVSKITRIFVR